MGTWGPGIFSNDTAEDVRAEFRKLVAGGAEPDAAVEQMVASYAINAGADDPDGHLEDIGAIQFWTGLALTQVQCGRLTERVKSAVLRIAESGADARCWQDAPPQDQRRRAAALQKLVEKVTGPQRKPTRIKLPWREQTALKPGDCLAYRLLSGRWIALRVVAIEEDSPMFDVLEGEWNAPPGAAEVAASGHRHTRGLSERIREMCSDLKTSLPPGAKEGPFEELFSTAVAASSPRVQEYFHVIRPRDGFMVVAQSEPGTLPAARVQPITTGAPTPAPPEFDFPHLSWDVLDEHLRDEYELQ